MNKSYTVTEIKDKIAGIARHYGIQKAYLFGSHAKGHAGLDSDIDICIEKGKIRTLFELSGFCQDLEETLENKVDVITTAGLSEDFKKKIEKDMILIYG
ncbi:MAG: nucleotidyltransferase domain-containing protein [Treponema sp.]|nr:nucleotidyltransferase domain-containing protein [Treponema sp.]